MKKMILKNLNSNDYNDYITHLKSDNIGSNIRYFRVEIAKMTQENFAKEINVVRSTLANYELINRSVPLDILLRIADLFNVSLDVLCCRKKFLEGKGANYENV